MINYEYALSVTKSDTAYLTANGHIRNGGTTAADINILPVNYTNTNTPASGVLIKNVQPGAIIPIAAKKVFSTSTAATIIEVYVP